MAYRDTARETVLINITSLRDVWSKPDEVPGRPNVIVFDFDNTYDATQFAKKYKTQPTKKNPNIVVVGKDKADYIFDKLGIGIFARRPMYNALVRETSQRIPMIPSTIPSKILTSCTNLYSPDAICFYESSQSYYEFTNFYPAKITIDGKDYPTSGHYFQSQKFVPQQPQIAEEIRNTPTPREALDIARNYENLIRPDWHQGYNDTIMKKALMAKFIQHNDLKQLLLDTGNKLLVEHTTNDNYWGDNGDGTGENKLGKLLMEVRGELRSTPQFQVTPQFQPPPQFQQSPQFQSSPQYQPVPQFQTQYQMTSQLQEILNKIDNITQQKNIIEGLETQITLAKYADVPEELMPEYYKS
jgi:ribA/ribD-fused uncharacterized protein